MLHVDTRRFVEQQLGVEQWVPAYGHVPNASGTLFCALIPNDRSRAALDNMGWDLMIGQGTPGISISFKGGKEERTYHRLGDYGGIEPLVLVSDFHGLHSCTSSRRRGSPCSATGSAELPVATSGSSDRSLGSAARLFATSTGCSQTPRAMATAIAAVRGSITAEHVRALRERAPLSAETGRR